MAQLTQSIAYAPIIDPKNRKLDWKVVVPMTVLHLGCIAAFWYTTWASVLLGVIFLYIAGCWGITLCYHRLLTHQSYKVPKWLKYFLTLCACIAWQGSPLQWVGTHRFHHRDSDQEADPHTPKHGFNWGHMAWVLYRSHPDFKPYDAAKDLQKDAGLMFIDRWFWIPQVVLAGAMFAAGYFFAQQMGHDPIHEAIAWLVWGIAVRTTVGYHGTWFVNSATHTWGYRNFESGDDSRNSFWVAFLSFGEGWHNNHHAFQRSAAHGMKWWEFDVTYLAIRVLKAVGLASDVYLPSQDMMAKKAIGKVPVLSQMTPASQSKTSLETAGKVDSTKDADSEKSKHSAA